MSDVKTDTRCWMDTAMETFLAAVDDLDDAAWDAASLLPDWRPREVVAHVQLNAAALRNLATWAAPGVEMPMYTSPAERDADIVHTAEIAAPRLRELVHTSAQALAADVDALSEVAWQHWVVTAQGRIVPATEILWMRTCEVAIHAIDLETGVIFEHLDAHLVDALVRVVTADAPAPWRGRHPGLVAHRPRTCRSRFSARGSLTDAVYDEPRTRALAAARIP